MRAIYKSKHDFMLTELEKYSWVREIMGETPACIFWWKWIQTARSRM